MYFCREKTQVNISDPCLPVGLTQEVKDTQGQVHFLRGQGDYEACSSKLVKLLTWNSSIICEQAPCSMNGVHQPVISFHNSEFYGFSEFWYTMDDVFRIGGIYNYEKFDYEAKVNLTRDLVEAQKTYRTLFCIKNCHLLHISLYQPVLLFIFFTFFIRTTWTVQQILMWQQ